MEGLGALASSFPLERDCGPDGRRSGQGAWARGGAGARVPAKGRAGSAAAPGGAAGGPPGARAAFPAAGLASGRGAPLRLSSRISSGRSAEPGPRAALADDGAQTQDWTRHKPRAPDKAEEEPAEEPHHMHTGSRTAHMSPRVARTLGFHRCQPSGGHPRRKPAPWACRAPKRMRARSLWRHGVNGVLVFPYTVVVLI